MQFFLQTLPLRIALCAVVLGIPAFAFASENYTVSPLVIDHNLKKRDIVTETITLTNNSSQVVRVYPTVNEVSVDEGGTIQSFVEPSMTDRTTSITSWLEITRARIELQPSEKKELTLTIRMNPEVPAGEYHALVSFPDGSNRPEAENKITTGAVPGTIVRIGVDQEQNQFLRLEKFTIDRFVKSNTKGQISYTLVNPGADPVIPGGEIIFYDNRGNEVSSTTVNSEQKTIDPGATVTFTQNVPKNLSMGKYKAFLSVEYGAVQTQSVHDTAFFYVLPLKQLIVIFAIVLLIAVAFALFIHRRFDMGADKSDGATDIALYIRSSRSESKEHDIDLSKKNSD